MPNLLNKIKPTDQLTQLAKKSKVLTAVLKFAKRKQFLKHQGVSWFDVFTYFFKWLDWRDLQLRATSLSFVFFLALFPSIIFIFTLIAYLPVKNFHENILVFIEGLLPISAYEAVKTTLLDILKNQRSGLLSFGFLTAIYFSTNGFVSLMNALNKYGKQKETRSFWKKRLVAIILTLIVSFSLFVAVGLITIGSYSIQYLDRLAYFPSKITPVLLFGLNLFVVASLILFFISMIFYLAPAKHKKWNFISAGAVLSSICMMVTMMAFSTYINQFNAYNKLYGSIGVLIVIMLMIYINTYILLLGYEFNIAIDKTLQVFEKHKVAKSNVVIIEQAE